MERTIGGMDPAETLREARRKQDHTRRVYEDAKRKVLSPDESAQEWSQHLHELQEAAEAADAEMLRLRPERPRADDSTHDGYVPPMAPGASN